MKLAVAVIVLLAVAPVAASGETWPAKPVRIVAPFAPGGSADTLGRLVAQRLGHSLKQQFIVENRAGAGGLLGSEMVARAAPDGYTLVISGIASHVIAPAVNPNAPFDPLADFTHIALLGGPPNILVVQRSLGIATLADFIVLAKSKQGRLSYASPGIGTLGHLAMEILQQRAGFAAAHVPYRGGALAMGDLIGGHVPAVTTTLTTAAEHVRAGTVRGLAMTSARRLPEYPDVPTFAELGHPALVATTWFALSGPARMPAEIVRRLNAEVIRALREPEIRLRLQRDGIDPEPLDQAAFTAFFRSEIELWGPVVRASGAKPN